jgi:N-dimethylarginine dimethylaminohydrolase
MPLLMNRTVLMSGTDYFSNDQAINAYMDASVPIDTERARDEHTAIKQAMGLAGISVIQVPPPKGCQDGVYTANWALCRNGKAIMARLPNARKDEESYAEQILHDHGMQIYKVPDDLRFSGQGDALPCGDLLFAGSSYRTDQHAHPFIGETLDYNVISLQTIPKRQWHGWGPRVINKYSGLPDSFYYDIDLALSILRFPVGKDKGLIAWCPAAFTHESRMRLQQLDSVEKIEVSRDEATNGFACNLVSTGESVIMSAQAPMLSAELRQRGFTVITPKITELAKGGGYIRCTTLTLDNE